MKYKLIIFDFDGTLADSFPWFISVINQVADKYKFNGIEAADVETIRGFSTKQILNHLGIPTWKMPMIVKHVRALMAKDISKIKLFAGIDALLKNLAKEGIKLGIVSSNSQENISRVLGSVNLAYMDYTECGVSIFGKVSKLKKVLKQSGINQEHVIYVGDETRDIEAAKKAKISSGAVSWGYNQIQILKTKSPDEVFFTVNEITALGSIRR